MNIGVAANFLIFEKAGIGKYSQNLLEALLKVDQKNHYFLYFSFLRKRKSRLEQIEAFLKKNESPNVSARIIPLPASWLEFLGATPFPLRKIYRDRLDIFFAPYVAGIPKNGFAKMVATIHDLVFLRFPEHRGRRLSNYYLRRHKIALENCQKIIVPSEATKEDTVGFLKTNPKKIIVIKEAANRRFRPIQNKKAISQVIQKYFNPKSPYLLTVGTREPRKNLSKLVESFSLLPNKILRVYRLVIVGARGWNNEQLERTIVNLNLKEKVILAGFVKDEDLPYIYNGASLFVYPSLYEGFGLPPLEAMACGRPVIVSRTSSLPEVVGEAGLYVNPDNEKEIAAAIKNLLARPKLQKHLEKKGLARTKKFSWEKAALETLGVFEEVNSRKSENG